MTKPTREEVADAITRIEYYRDAWVEDFNVLKNAYLSQEEELKEVNDRRMELIAMVEQLKAENQALKERLDWFRDEREKDGRVIDKLINEKRKLENYLAEKEGYRP